MSNKNRLIKIKIRGIDFYTTKQNITVINYEQFEPFSLDLLLQYIKPNSTFLDIGAHYGIYSTIIGSKIKNIKVLAVEPVIENFKILKKNLKINKIKHKILNYAASNKKSVKNFNVAEISSRSSFYKPLFSQVKKRIIVKTLPLDIIQEKIDFIKIDVEGHEIETLLGMKKIFKKNKKVKLLIEFNPNSQLASGKKPIELLKKLFNLCFDLYIIYEYPWQFPDYQKNNLEYKPIKKICKLTNKIYEWKKFINPQYHVNLLCIPKKYSLNILFFSHSSQFGGSEKSLLELIDELLEKDVMIMVVLPSDGPLKKHLDKKPVITEIANYCWWGRGENVLEETKINENTNSFSSLFDLLPKIEAFDPDVIYTNTVSIPWGAITAMLLNKPHIWHIREYGKIDHNLFFDLGEEETKKFINFTSNAVITNSKSVKDFYKDFVDEKKITVAYNYIHIPKELLKEKTKEKIFKYKNSTKLLILGTIMPSKGQMDAVLATDILIEKKHKVELAIVGAVANKEYLEKIKKYIQEKNLEQYVHLKEFVENPYPIIKSANIVLTCSKNEAFGRGTVEAMLLKKTVIGTKSGGTEELIKDGYDGFLYKPGNFQELAEKIEYLIKNKEKIKELGQNGYQSVKKNITKENYGGKIYEILNMVKNQQPIFKKYQLLTKPFTLAYQNKLTTLTTQNTQLNQQLSQKNQEIEHFKNQIKELEIKLMKIEEEKRKKEEVERKKAKELEKENQAIRTQIDQTRAHIQNLETQLNTIKSAKFFKLWQGYCKIMKLLKLKS